MLGDFLETGDEVGNIVLHKPLGKPENVCTVAVGMVKIAGVIHFTDNGLVRGETAGGTDAVDRVMTDFDIRAVDIQNIFLPL